MNGAKAAVISVIVVFTLILVGIVLYTSQTRTTPTPLPSPVQESTSPTPSPTPSEQTIEGEILTLATTPIGFKNSYVATIEQTDGTSALLYITEETVIQSTQGAEVTRTSLRVGTRVVVVTAPAEGGHEAIQIQIVPSTGTTPPVSVTQSQTAPNDPESN